MIQTHRYHEDFVMLLTILNGTRLRLHYVRETDSSMNKQFSLEFSVVLCAVLSH